ncbi:HNH endonuclease [Halorussus limi]|uniref:HNH endonuclease n=1 Tax=Halorussus limi TaxID=2938695 RepID=A0A8U0HS88_9EURY|nr:HNH endonuclease [Halorussus limi]UPV73729.1 HNH endonuclease [Halorussus limi]
MSTTQPTSTTTESSTDTTEPKYRDEEFLREAYCEKGLSQREIAARCGCSRGAIRHHMDKFDISPRSTRSPSDRPANFDTKENGYERWRCQAGETDDYVYVHRLLATLKVDDLSELEGMHVHHKDGHPFDNRPDNIEVVSPAEHRQKHADDEPLKAEQ